MIHPLPLRFDGCCIVLLLIIANALIWLVDIFSRRKTKHKYHPPRWW